MRLRRWTFAVITALLFAIVAARADEREAPRPGDAAADVDPAAGIATTARPESEVSGPDETGLLGPLRIRDMTPFNLLRLDMLPAHAVDAGPGSWAIEA